MTTKKQSSLGPKLRFPKLREASAWSVAPLDKVCTVLNKRRIPITTRDRKAGPYPYYGASGIMDYVDDFIFDERLVLVGEDGAKWGAFEPTAFVAEGKFWVNNHAHVLRTVDLIDTLLEAYLVRSDLSRYVTGAAPPKLTLGKLKSILVPIPSSPGEQRKIADCLGSIDGLIAAQEQKLEGLRQHKQGLMQRLFPQPGETVPRLRFPEFSDVGKWVPRKLQDFLVLNYGMSLPAKDRVQGEFPVYGSNGIVGTHNEAFVSERGIVIGRKGSAGHVHLSPGPFCPIDTTFYLTINDVLEVEFHFLYFLLKHVGLREIKDLGSVPGLNRKIAYMTTAFLPSSRREQRKIADCLSLLDDLIAAQEQKLESLRQHKQALMQQLFPTPE